MTQTYKCGVPDASGSARLEQVLDPALFKALSDPNRVALLARLGAQGRPTTVTEAAACCPVDLSVVSRHLAILRDAGILHAEKHGREVRYTVSHSDLSRTLREVADRLDECCRPGCCPDDEQDDTRGDQR